VHLEYNKEGTEVWVAVWGTMEDVTAVLVYDDKTLELIEEITGDWMRTPTGHFNVYNTVHDIY
jgi:nitrite reductase (NO-forming)/hydroxylamine reductase